MQKLSFTIKTGKLKIQDIPEIIACKGKIIASPDEIAIVSVPIQGAIRKLNVSHGKYIKKGMPVAIIENSEIISLQEEYLIIKSEYGYYKEDFKRQGELNLENATSMKIMQKAQHDFQKAEAHLQSLKKRLELIGLNPDSVESKKLQSTITVFAPISGYVSQVNAKLGLFCKIETPLCMISGDQNPMLQLHADESKSGKITVGQSVDFSILTNPDKIYNATITGIEPDNGEPIVFVYAEIKNENFQIGIPVDAAIMAGKQSVFTIPTESVIHRNDKTFVFNKTDDNCFAITEIKTGKTIGNEQEISVITENPDQTEYVISGAQNIYKLYELKMSNVR
jgi:cobalt-zinc-cadmium efflux system membrane fusion protein